MENGRFKHRVERTRNKHSRAICRDNTIIIRLARNLSAAEEREHIASLLRRMTQVLLEEKQKRLIHPFRHLLEGGTSQTVTLSNGRSYRFTLTPATRTSVREARDGWTIAIGPNVRRRSLHRLLWNLIADAESERMDALVRRINALTYRERIASVRCAFAGTQWGSCSPRGVIMLNAALLFVPQSLLNYVIVHELAHRKVSDHSDRFWKRVAEAMPQYEKACEKLKGYRLPTL